MPVAYRLLENSTTWMTTGATQAPASSAATLPMPNATRKRAAPGFCDVKPAREPREIDHQDVEHRERQDDEQRRDPDVEPRRRVDGAERAADQDDDEAEHAVDDGHRAAVGRPEEKAACARSRLRACADDGQVDRNHRQHARREVQRQPADEDEQQNRQRPAPLEQPSLDDACLGVPDELEELGACPRSSCCRPR